MKSIFGFLAALALALVVAGIVVRPPGPVSDEAPATAFSAERAMADVRAIGQVPHPTGTAANRQVRDLLVQRMRDLGLQVSIQSAESVENRGPGFAAGGHVENLIGVWPGLDPNAPAVVLMSHYDSAIGSPGAADDAAGVAASLEAVRALRADDPSLQRSLVVLITDGEEQGLLGAGAFFRQNPLPMPVGAVVNLEARGAAGRAVMFETGRMNGAMMGLYADHVRQPSATSLAAFLYSVLPNDTDFSHSRDLGLPGFNIAFIDDPFEYHSPTSTPDVLDPGTLQHMGDQALSLTGALLTAPALPAAHPNAVFSDIFGLFTLVYPAWVGWIVVALSGLALVGLALRSTPRGETLRVAAVGLLSGLVIAGVCGLLGQGLLILTGASTDFIMNRPLLGRLQTFEWAMFAISLGGVLVTGHLMLRSRPGLYRPHEGPALGLLSFGWLIALALQIWAPEAAIIAAWPTLIGSLGLLAARRLGGWSWPVAMLLGIVGAAWMLSANHMIFLGVGPTMPAAPAALSALVILPMTALLVDAARSRLALIVGVTALMVAGGLGVWLRVAPQATSDHPAPTLMLYVDDPATDTARLASPVDMVDRWTRQVLDAQRSDTTNAEIPALGTMTWSTVPAAPVETTSPEFSLTILPDGRHEIRVTDPAARELRLEITTEGTLSDIRLAGLPVTPPARGEPLRLRWADVSRGLVLTLSAPSDTVIRWAAFHDGWPEDAPPLPPRGASFVPFGPSDSLVVIGKVPLTPPG